MKQFIALCVFELSHILIAYLSLWAHQTVYYKCCGINEKQLTLSWDSNELFHFCLLCNHTVSVCDIWLSWLAFLFFMFFECQLLIVCMLLWCFCILFQRGLYEGIILVSVHTCVDCFSEETFWLKTIHYDVNVHGSCYAFLVKRNISVTVVQIPVQTLIPYPSAMSEWCLRFSSAQAVIHGWASGLRMSLTSMWGRCVSCLEKTGMILGSAPEAWFQWILSSRCSCWSTRTTWHLPGQTAQTRQHAIDSLTSGRELSSGP